MLIKKNIYLRKNVRGSCIKIKRNKKSNKKNNKKINKTRKIQKVTKQKKIKE